MISWSHYESIDCASAGKGFSCQRGSGALGGVGFKVSPFGGRVVRGVRDKRGEVGGVDWVMLVG